MGESGLCRRRRCRHTRLRCGICCQYAFFAQVAGKLQCSRQFGRGVPAADAAGVFHKFPVFLFVNLFHLSGKLLAGHFPAEVRAFDMQSEYGAVRFFHEPFAHMGGLVELAEGGGGDGGVEACGAMLEVCLHDAAECFLGTFVEVVSAAAMGVHTHETGHYVHAFGINYCCTDNSQVAVSYFQDFSVANEDRAVFQPSLWGKNMPIYDLSQHNRRVFKSLKKFVGTFHQFSHCPYGTNIQVAVKSMMSASFPLSSVPLRSSTPIMRQVFLKPF